MRNLKRIWRLVGKCKVRAFPKLSQLLMVSPRNLTLRHFLLRQQVLDLYRNAIRASRGVIF